MTISKGLLDELLKGCERPEDLLGDAGLMKELKIRLMERMPGAELTAHPLPGSGSAAYPMPCWTRCAGGKRGRWSGCIPLRSSTPSGSKSAMPPLVHASMHCRAVDSRMVRSVNRPGFTGDL